MMDKVLLFLSMLFHHHYNADYSNTIAHGFSDIRVKHAEKVQNAPGLTHAALKCHFDIIACFIVARDAYFFIIYRYISFSSDAILPTRAYQQYRYFLPFLLSPISQMLILSGRLSTGTAMPRRRFRGRAFRRGEAASLFSAADFACS